VKGNGREGGEGGWNIRENRRGEIKQESENGEEWEEAGEAEKMVHLCSAYNTQWERRPCKA